MIYLISYYVPSMKMGTDSSVSMVVCWPCIFKPEVRFGRIPLLTRVVALVAVGTLVASGRLRMRDEGLFFSALRRCRLVVEVLGPIYNSVDALLVETVRFYDLATLR